MNSYTQSQLNSLPAIYSNGDTKIKKLPDGTFAIVENRWVDRPKHIDGHFWVEDADGNIINDITMLPHQQKFEAKGEKVVRYHPSPEDEARYIQHKYDDITATNISHYESEDAYYADLASKDLHSFDCYQNAMLTAYRTGHRVRFGFIGALKPNGMIYWYFGHPDNTYDDFEGDPNQSFQEIKNTRETHISSHPQLVAKIEREKAKKEAEEKERAEYLKRKQAEDLKKKEAVAKKAEEELFAMLDKEEKQSKKKNNKKSKK
jgi:hypothetical protein